MPSLPDRHNAGGSGKAWPDAGQSESAYINSRMEKVQESANVLANMQEAQRLLNELGFVDMLPAAQDYLRDRWIPGALGITNEDGDQILNISRLEAFSRPKPDALPARVRQTNSPLSACFPLWQSSN